ncbi:MAG TPA: DUF4256 domain-containing protein [Treponemataceae bacterium]|jgi:hypothetical protein|nr:DUF4256 domain-containing protein [Treponemataceae bacterium]
MSDLYSALLEVLEKRFYEHKERHPDVEWNFVKSILTGQEKYLSVIQKMEETGGESDVVGNTEDGCLSIIDCSKETPSGRRSLCYDEEALQSRKKNKPADSAIHLAQEIGIEILDEEQYQYLQKYGCFDEKTSSWIKTPHDIRALGGALFCDRRYGRVFTYHNGAESYYSVRGFRGILKIWKQ